MGWLIKWILIISIVYYILNKLVLPVFRSMVFGDSRTHQMQQMQDKLREMEQQMKASQQQPEQKRTGSGNSGEYIDYEEVK